jgi:uncharacterized LabA/DUF88 family protein
MWYNSFVKYNNYAFIDSQNLNIGVSSDIPLDDKLIYSGWKLDFSKFRKFLEDKYRVTRAFLFIGNLPGNEDLYTSLQRQGFVLSLKPTMTHKDKSGKRCVKGNVDTDIVLHAAAIEFDNYDKAVIVTGDGDFISLCDYLDERDKLAKVLIPNKHRYSRLFAKFTGKVDFVSTRRRTLERI